ncbi:MAG: hypothetical protein ACOX8H_12535 [Ruminococcus sp.]
MKRKKKRAAVILALLAAAGSLWGCSKKEGEETAMIEEAAVKEFQKLMNEDQKGDGKSVFWDGSQAKVAEDRQDIPNVLDGRGGFQSFETIKKEQWSMKLSQKKEYETVSDQEEDYRLKGEGWYLEIVKKEFQEGRQEMENSPAMEEVTEKELNRNVKERNEKAALYRGLVEVDGSVLAGYTLLAQDYFGNSWQVGYYGMGNINEVKAQALRTIDSFQPNVDLSGIM